MIDNSFAQHDRRVEAGQAQCMSSCILTQDKETQWTREGQRRLTHLLEGAQGGSAPLGGRRGGDPRGLSLGGEPLVAGLGRKGGRMERKRKDWASRKESSRTECAAVTGIY